ncbi:MAG: type II toxin-antitoxin system RelE/ParE family toxin [Dethiobacter sp.]|jgi:toxin ParE1/3/4|nr:type II toxin-antitoxin system RelE/ParE family toxin [Dethiobacter sp.]MBS3901385.1 type II toxin-antitoxin system RelE/ParE family toxin [Dethiobacter sp.]MBS3988681.1 type II toxin-antitoxin system RelE/ParE family toxin [Dethiobacter sp.]
MRSKSKIKYSPAAVDDMDEIFSYISQDNFGAAEFILDKLDREIRKLESFPNLGSVLPEDEYSIIQAGYRLIVIKPYLVFYRIVNDLIIIHRILHGRRDYLRELFNPNE